MEEIIMAIYFSFAQTLNKSKLNDHIHVINLWAWAFSFLHV
jgi:hypothetical protein